jgi:hypothetical protein
MPISFELDAARRRVHFIITGVITLREVLEIVRAVLAIPEFGPEFQVLSDHRGVEQPITVPEVQEMLAHMRASRERFRDVRWAVVTQRPSSFVVMGLLSTLADLHVQMDVRVFTRLDEALRWLDGE